MMLWVRMAFRNALRNVRRTMLTAATVVVGVALVVLALSWINGIFGRVMEAYTAQSGHMRIVDQDFREREELQPLYENIPDVEGLRDAVLSVDGVVDAQPRIQMGVVITADEEIGDDFTLAVGAPQEYYTRWMGAPEKMVAGRFLDPASDREIVLGAKVAEQLGVGVGAEVVLIGQTQYGSMSPTKLDVVGVIGGDALLRSQVLIPFSEMQYVADIPDGAVELLVYTSSREPVVVSLVAQRLRGLEAVGDELWVEPWYTREPWSSIRQIIGAIQGFIQFLIVFITALAIFNTMTMSVLERTQEIGVMRAMGLSRLGTMFLFLVESATIGLLGGVGGVLVALGPALYLSKHGITLGGIADRMTSAFPFEETFYADFSMEVVIQGIALGVATAVLGAALPALRAAAVRPVVAMRARR